MANLSEQIIYEIHLYLTGRECNKFIRMCKNVNNYLKENRIFQSVILYDNIPKNFNKYSHIIKLYCGGNITSIPPELINLKVLNC